MYKVVKCPKCKRFSMTSADVSFRCVVCSKTSDVTKMRVYYATDSPQIATKVLQRLKEEEAREKFGDERYDRFM